jgi:histidinol dehydrogenase
MIKITKYPQPNDWAKLLQRPSIETAKLEKTVADIIQRVKEDGDNALRNYAMHYDGVKLQSLEVPENEIFNAVNEISISLQQAIRVAYNNILAFHSVQNQTEPYVETVSGVMCWRKSIPVQKVGLYIPGGSAPLFSTVLMLGVPAKIAGCSETILCTPCDKNEKVNAAILYAADLCGIKKIYKVGGAQAIAAMAFGTQSINKVYKIFGPGNQFVTCAKQLVQNYGIAIDMPAGPSEVAILADRQANAAFVAADILAQLEHGADSQSILVTDYLPFADEVNTEIEKQISSLPRSELALKAIANSKIIIVMSMEEGMNLINEYAPEHLILAVEDSTEIAQGITNAGSVFLGNYSPESAGDYATGTNHTLPTNGYAKSYSGVSLDSFVKKITFQKLTKAGLSLLSNTIIEMAEAEGLQAHANAVKIRM